MNFSNKKLTRYLVFFGMIFAAIEITGYYIGMKKNPEADLIAAAKQIRRKSLAELKGKNMELKYRINNLSPAGTYIVVDTGRNILSLKQGNKVIHEAVISSGSGSILKDPDGKRQWIFDTPRGIHHVESKKTSPVWTKPDWAFIEDGENIPKKSKDRLEPGVLGDYALGFGDGYFIHGTLYTRLLGRNVTHGCIRVGDKDLKTVYMASGIGTRIFIF
jgi:lipoprotein-anchoring transpeptidase ErfK/SrfK